MNIFRENNFDDNDFLVVSFFTQSYKNKAQRFVESVENFKLNYKVFEIPTIHYSKSNKGSYDINYCMPKLILKVIEKYNVPILFLDVDMVITEKPQLIFDINKKKIDFAIYNWFDDPENDGYLPIKLDIDTNKGKISKKFYINSLGVKLINDPKKDRQLFSSGGVAYFSNRSISIRLLNEWLENIKRYPKAPDDQLLDYTFNYTTGVKKDLNVEWLTKSYCRVHWWIFDRPVINHPSNLSHREDDNFFKITGKQRFKIENTKKRLTERYSKNELIDVENKSVYEVIKGKIHLIKKFEESIYI